MAAWGMLALGEPRGRVEGVAYAHMREHTRESPHCLVSLSPDLFWLLIIFVASRVVFCPCPDCRTVSCGTPFVMTYVVDACPMSVSERRTGVSTARDSSDCPSRARVRAAASGPDLRVIIVMVIAYGVVIVKTYSYTPAAALGRPRSRPMPNAST
jgi:hypothetical protein